MILKIHEGHPNVVDHMRAGRVSLLINTPMGHFAQQEDGYIRSEAVRHKIPYTTTTSAASAAAKGIRTLREGGHHVRPLPVGRFTRD